MLILYKGLFFLKYIFHMFEKMKNILCSKIVYIFLPKFQNKNIIIY